MTVTIRLFSLLRERAGSDRVQLELADGATVADALQALSKIPSLAGVLERLPVQMAVNRDYASPQTPLDSDDELALIPPLSGGSAPRIHVAVTARPLSLEALSGIVSDTHAGALVTFQGVTREVSRLEYEAYEEMATERISQIARECLTSHGLCAVAVEHRVGAVPLGEPSVIVAVAAPHRAEAFAGAREIIDRVKAEAPIWKLEIDAHGDATPVGGTAAPGAEPLPAAERLPADPSPAGRRGTP
jgi:molybdopterin synthase catalytic subunit/molybdopterin converting factor small subunit